MEWDVYLRTVLALAFVLAMIAAAAWGAKRYGLGGARIGPRRRRLAVVEVLQVDSRRRLVLVRRDEVEHLLLIGGGSDMIVESKIAGAAGAAQGDQTR